MSYYQDEHLTGPARRATFVDDSGTTTEVDYSWSHVLPAIDAVAASVDPELAPVAATAATIASVISGPPAIIIDDIPMGEVTVAEITRFVAERLQSYAVDNTDPTSSARATAWEQRAALDRLGAQWPRTGIVDRAIAEDRGQSRMVADYVPVILRLAEILPTEDS